MGAQAPCPCFNSKLAPAPCQCTTVRFHFAVTALTIPMSFQMTIPMEVLLRVSWMIRHCGHCQWHFLPTPGPSRLY